MDTSNLKVIKYRGGLVRFRIPADWEEEYEEDGGGTFYGPGRDAGTFRLNILTFEGPAEKPLVASAAVEVLAPSAAKHRAQVVPLRDGIAMIRYDLPSQESAESLMIRYWEVSQIVPPKHMRIAMFSYALLDEHFKDTSHEAELELLDREIRAAEFAGMLGVTAAPKKPWWRPW